MKVYPVAIGAHIMCLCGDIFRLRAVAGIPAHHPLKCAPAAARLDWALEHKVKTEKSNGWCLVKHPDGLEFPHRKNHAAKGVQRVVRGFQIRSFNAKARAAGLETIPP